MDPSTFVLGDWQCDQALPPPQSREGRPNIDFIHKIKYVFYYLSKIKKSFVDK